MSWTTAEELGIQAGDIMYYGKKKVRVISTRTIPLTKNMITVADIEDYPKYGVYVCADMLKKEVDRD
jgi:hypothetical protein